MRRTFSKGDGHKRRGAPEQKAGPRDLSLPQSQPFQGLSRLRSEMDRLFDRFIGSGLGSALSHPFSGMSWMPSVEVKDSDKEFTVRAELPGLDAKDIEVSVAGDHLILSGEKKQESEEKGKTFYRSERRYGSFRRAIPLAPGADAGKVSAEYDKGILTVHIPKSETLKPKRIEVSSPAVKK